MHGYIPRYAQKQVLDALRRAPVVAVLGPRQCGKSTLARHVTNDQDSIYLDLQSRSDLAKVSEPELFFDAHRHHLVCLDEIQRLPDFFSVLRVEVDKARRPGRFLLLGSASRDLLRQSAETLAGRIAFVHLTPFIWHEVRGAQPLTTCWLRGGFPESAMAAGDTESLAWRHDFVRTFLERDIPAFGLSVPIPVVERLWRLLAHYHGQTLNYSKLAGAVDIAVQTLKNYLGILEQTYMIRVLQPAEANLKKRLVKAPKVYIRDSGILHALLDIPDYDNLLGHPAAGPSWEGFAIENILTLNPQWHPYFLRTGHGAEVDLLLELGTRSVLVEFKLSKAPKPSRGFHELVRGIRPEKAWLVAPVDDTYLLSDNIEVRNMDSLVLE